MGGLGGVHTSKCKEAIGDAHIYEAGKKVKIWVLLSLSTRVEVFRVCCHTSPFDQWPVCC